MVLEIWLLAKTNKSPHLHSHAPLLAVGSINTTLVGKAIGSSNKTHVGKTTGRPAKGAKCTKRASKKPEPVVKKRQRGAVTAVSEAPDPWEPRGSEGDPRGIREGSRGIRRFQWGIRGDPDVLEASFAWEMADGCRTEVSLL